jgi:tetratricopeptide (TPR) repeat protein
VLVNLWASWCVPCVGELTELTERAGELREAGLEVVAVSVDEPDKHGDADALLDRLEWPFRRGFATPEMLEALDVLQRRIVYRKRDMPVPTSFLVTAEGMAAFVYKGAVEVDTLLEDISTLHLPPRKVRYHAAGNAPAASDVLSRLILPRGDASSLEIRTAHTQILGAAQRIAGDLIQSQHWREAVAMCDIVLEIEPDNWTWHRHVAGCHSMLGSFADAVEHHRRAAALQPTKVFLRVELGTTLLRAGQTGEAVDVLEAALRDRPGNFQARLGLALALQQQGRTQQALVEVKKALEIRPSSPEALQVLESLEGG